MLSQVQRKNGKKQTKKRKSSMVSNEKKWTMMSPFGAE